MLISLRHAEARTQQRTRGNDDTVLPTTSHHHCATPFCHSMDRLNRLVAITLRLQSRRIVRAEDLAEDFGISVRTVYRDLRALEEAGLPIYAEAGKGYSLLEGYHLPPVMFTQEEAAALFLGGEFTERLTDESLRGHARSALMEIRAVLPPERKEFIERVGSATAVYIPAPQPTFAPHAHLSLIQEAIAHRTVVEIAYQSGLRERTTRAVEPLGLVYYASHWHLIAWCRLRLDVRDFRSDRIMAIRPLGESFPERHGFSIREHVVHTMREGGTTYPVRVRFTREGARFTADRYKFGFAEERVVGDWVEMLFYVPSLTWIAGWILSFAHHAEVLEPQALRDVLHQWAEALLQKYRPLVPEE